MTELDRMQSYLSPVKSQSGEFELRSGMNRFGHFWAPDSETPWASLTIVHGFGDHSGRFAGMATSLASLGIGVLAIDLVGHGRSPGRRGCIESYDQLLDEVEWAQSQAGKLWPRIPRFLFGQSMGGNLVINWALRRADRDTNIRGIVCGSPMIKPGKMPKESFMNAGRWLARHIPHLRIRTPVEVTKLSQDRRAQDAYLRDPFVHRHMSLRLASSLIDSGEWALANAHSLRIPSLLMHGLDDTLTCPIATEAFATRAGQLATFRGWQGCRHDLHDEPQRERVFAFMTHWLKERCIQAYRISTKPMASLSHASELLTPSLKAA